MLLLVQCFLFVQSSQWVHTHAHVEGTSKQTQIEERSCVGTALLNHKLQLHRDLHRGQYPSLDREVKPMKCGALVFLHLGKTGGSSVAQLLEQASPISNHTYFDVWHKHKANYDYSADEDWQALLKAASSDEPQIVAQLHHGVPGMGCYFWEHELAPLQEKLEAKGCELRLTTVLRNATARPVSGMNYYNQLMARDPLEYRFPTGQTPCEKANKSANKQAKELVNGLCGPFSCNAWPTVCKDGFSDEQLLQKSKSMLSKMFLIGKTEELQTYADTLLQVMSLKPGTVELGTENPTSEKYKENLTQDDLDCFSTYNRVDDALWSSLLDKNWSPPRAQIPIIFFSWCLFLRGVGHVAMFSY